ncbi:MAG: phage tail tube protein, partial [Planctomycetota bacterium]
AQIFTGLRQRRHHRIFKATLEGSLQAPLYSHHLSGKSIAQHLLEWLFSAPNDVSLDSFSAEFFEAGTDNKRHLGLRPTRGIISGNAETGSLSLTLDLRGKEEQGGVITPSLVPTSPVPTEILFKDCLFTIDGQAVSLQSFELTINNNLQIYHNNSYWPSLIVAGTREVDYRFSLFKTDNTYDLMRRGAASERPASLVLKGAHNGTGPSGNFTTITFDFPRIALRDADDTAGLNDLVGQNIDTVVLKPNTTANEVNLTFGTTS